MNLPPQLEAKFQTLEKRYPLLRSALIPMLLYAQDQFGYVSNEMVAEIARRLGLNTLQVTETMAYYSMLRRKPAGKYILQVCRNISCFLAGATDIVAYLESRLGVRAGGTTADGKFTLMTVECLGNCDHAPCLMINDDDYGPVTRETLDGLLKRLV